MFIKYDFKEGILYRLKIFIPVVIMFLLPCMKLFLNSDNNSLSYMDYLLNIFGGSGLRTDGFKFIQIPYIWIMIHIYSLFVVCRYPYDNMRGQGIQVIIRSSTHSGWIISKFTWTSICLFFIYLTGYLTVLIFCVLTDHSHNVDLINNEIISDSILYHLCEIFFLPYLTITAISFVQLTITLLIKPIYGFIISSSIIGASVLFENKFFIANFSMLFRNSSFSVYMKDRCVNTLSAYFLISIILLFCVILCVLFFRYKDLY